jgi:hypothetical protein
MICDVSARKLLDFNLALSLEMVILGFTVNPAINTLIIVARGHSSKKKIGNITWIYSATKTQHR